MWAGRFQESLDAVADKFNSSLPFDRRMFEDDIEGSMAHAAMLAKCGILQKSDVDLIMEGLTGILADMREGKLVADVGEDIHMFVEAELTARIGEVGKRLHTARSRNDQVAVDLRLYLRRESLAIIELLKALLASLAKQAAAHADTIMPGYTHLQRAQPITFGHHLLAYAAMLMRDISRIEDAVLRMNYSPLGSCALAGTTYPTDRAYAAELLGFDGACENSLDGVSDRDFVLELAGAFSTLMMHLSRLSEEIILWSSWEFRFVELSDAFTTGSSIMPQKKNSDMAELVRGKTGRVYGNMLALYTTLKGLPLAYNKDMQEDKEGIFDTVDTVKDCLTVFAPMIETMTVHPENMLAAAKGGFINATDVADYLTKKGMPFRSAYKITGELVARCIADRTDLSSLSLDVYREYSDLFEADVYHEIDLAVCVARRTSYGGTGPESVRHQLDLLEQYLAN